MFFLYFVCSAWCFASENIFYVLRFKTSDRMSPPIDTLTSLKKHFEKITILIPQAYNINATGIVNGEIEPDILDFALQHSMKIMPLITNTQFNKEVAHRFLYDALAQAKALKTIITFCKKNHFYGVQLDFEMVNIKDRDALTHFYEYAANELHKNGFSISFAVAPVVSDKLNSSYFLKKIYTNWEGAFDLKKLGKVADFVSIMAYNQHGGTTTPGPTASWEWTNQVVKYAMQYIPPQKISIGIPDYSTHWYTGSNADSGKIIVQSKGINFDECINFIHQHKATLQWDEKSKLYFSIFLHDWLNEYIFIEDIKSFTAKYALVKKYQLRGISVFDLGTEDPRIWEILT